MVLMHGYGGSGIMFWKVMKALSEHYYLIIVDILGMGASSRPKFNIIDGDEAD
jgi:pimeloyl-ACP methyl ester carboxylesterase